MAYSGRYLTRLAAMLALGLVMTGSAPDARAQPAAKPPVTFRTLALGAPVTDLFYDDHRGQPVPVTAGSSGFSAAYPAPDNGLVELYRIVPPATPEEQPRRVAVTDIRLGEGGPFLVFLLTDPAERTVTRGRVVDDSWDKHPVGTLQLFSFSRRSLAVKVGEQTAELTPGQSRLFDYPEAGHLWLQAATQERGQWVMRVGGPQLTLPQARSTVVLLDQEPSPERPNPDGLQVRNFIDPAPPES